MYYAKINGEQEGFASDRIRTRMRKIVKAARTNHRVEIIYKKKTGRVVRRQIAPYSYKLGLLYATDTRHGNRLIRSYVPSSIKGAKVLKATFKPEWEVEL